MATMDNMKEKANSAVQSAAKTARYVTQVSKKRMEILSEQEKIRRNYTKLGKVYYKDFVTDEEPDDAEYQPLCDAITASYCRINELREEMAAAKAAYNGKETPKTEEEEEEYDIIPLDEPITPEDTAEDSE